LRGTAGRATIAPHMPVKSLDGLSVFAGVSPERLARLAAVCEEKNVSANQVVFRRGERCDGLWAVLVGGVLMRTETPGKPIERMFDLGPGEIFGEAEVLETLEGAPRRLTARALDATTLVRIPLAPLRELLREQPSIDTSLRTLAIRRQSARVRAMLAPSSRREPRIWVDKDILVTVQSGARGESHRVRLLDLSNSGACILRAPSDWKKGQELSFSLGTQERPAMLQVRGTVQWRHESAVGIAFTDAGPVLRKKIEQTLRELVPG
jgi:CRP-like cAMP-binding protein